MDTNILSTFAKIQRLDLIRSLFEDFQISISDNVFTEIRKAVEKGYGFCEELIDMVHEDVIVVLSPTREEYRVANELPRSFGLGERDTVAMASRRGAIIATNEKKVVNYCRRNGITVVNLNHILRALWTSDILSKEEVGKIMQEMETKDNLLIEKKDDILSD